MFEFEDIKEYLREVNVRYGFSVVKLGKKYQ